MSLIRSAATIGGLTLVSRIFGFFRDMMIATYLGASLQSDCFFVAFKLPNFFRRLFAEGAFNAAFVPMFAGMLATDGPEKAKRFSEEVGSVLLVSLVSVTILAIFFMPQLMLVLAPGFTDNAEKFGLAVELSRITFPYLIFISLVSLLGAILNSYEKFAAVAATPILMNICFIISLPLFTPFTASQAHALAWGVILAGVVQHFWLVWFCRKHHIHPKIVVPRLTPQVKKLLKLIAPVALGAGVAQVNLMIDIIIASSLPDAVSYLYYADRIQELPLAVIGIAIGTALLPMMSKQIRSGQHDAARYQMNRALEFCMLFSMPAAAGMMLLALPIINVVFERGQFDAMDSAATFPALIAFAAGLPGFVLIKVFAPGFYSNEDTRTPFIIATSCVALNLAGNLLSVWLARKYGFEHIAHAGLALSTTLAGWVNALWMASILKKRGLFIPDALLTSRLWKIGVACGLMSIALFLAAPYATPLLEQGFLIRLLTLVALVGGGAALYGAVALGLRVVTLSQLKGYIKRR